MAAEAVSNNEEQMRQNFKQFNKFMVLMWRLGLGPFINSWPEVVGRIMVLVHTGRKSGLQRRTPVNYALVDDEVYCTAGFGPVSDWYKNILANPNVQVWLPEGWWQGVAEEVTDAEKRLPLLRQVLIASGYAAKAMDIDATKMSDAELDTATKEYCLFHIRRTEACTGEGGPGDLAWIWPVAVLVMLPIMFKRRRF